MNKKILPILTGGLNNVARPDLINDSELTESLNMEPLANGRLVRRKNAEEYNTKISTLLSSTFDTVLDISPPFYPPSKPDDMTGDFMLLVFGLKGSTYSLQAMYESDLDYSWSTNALTGLTSAGIVYSADSVLRFAIGADRVVVTDYEGDNLTHYFTVTAKGELVSGVMGIPAPRNKPGITQMTSFQSELFEENPDADSFSETGLIQVIYTVETAEGEESNPSPVSETLDMQFFKMGSEADTVDDADGTSSATYERYVEKVNISNLSVPSGLSTDILENLKYFNVYARVFKYSAGVVSKDFEFCQQHKIVDKSNTSGSTGNNYSINVSPTAGEIVSHENDIAPIAKYPAVLGGITVVGCCKTKVRFPFDFTNLTEIKINNQDSKTYIDAIIRLRLYDEDSADSKAIDTLDWDDFDTDDDDIIEELDNLRIYDNDLTTALPVIYQMDTGNKYCDIWIKIPQLPGSSVHSLYLAFGGTGVDDTNLQTAEYGEFILYSDWANQEVYEGGAKVYDNLTLLCSPVGVEKNTTHVLNKVNDSDKEFDKFTEASPPPHVPDYFYRWNFEDAVFNAASIAKVPAFNQLLGSDAIKISNSNGKAIIGDLELDDIPEKGFVSFYAYLPTPGPASVLTFYKDGSPGTKRQLSVDGGYWAIENNSTVERFTDSYASGYFFILLSWDGADVSLFLVNTATGAISSEEQTLAFDFPRTFDTLILGGVFDAESATDVRYNNIVFKKDVYLQASTHDIQVQNIANFQPAFDTMLGYNFTTHNNNITFEDTEQATYKTYENMLKYTDLNHLSFPDLYYKKVKDPVKGMIPAPSFLKMQYQNTILIFTRNSINRFLLTGSPADFHASADSIIEEKTQYALLADKTLVKVADILFWLSEVGVIKWDAKGMIPISKNRVDIQFPHHELENMIGFYCPIRNQYILHTQFEIVI